MAYTGGIATRRALSVVVVGARAPGFARGMGCQPVPTFADAAKRAERLRQPPLPMLVVPEVPKPAVHVRSEEA